MSLFHFLDGAVKSVEKLAGQAGIKVPPIAQNLVQTAQNMIPPGLQQGFQQGMNVLQAGGLNANILNTARNAIPGLGKQGFDMALAFVHGHVNGPPPPAEIVANPQALAAWNIAHGMQLNDPGNVATVTRTLAAVPAAAPGATAAIATIRANDSWYHRMFRFLGFAH